MMIFQKLIGYFPPSLDKEGRCVAPGWFDPGGDYPIILLKIIMEMGVRRDSQNSRSPGTGRRTDPWAASRVSSGQAITRAL